METLTKKEEQVMHIIWEQKKGFVKDFIALMPDPKPPYNTVSSIVRILVKKGFVDFKQYGNTYEYFPKITKKKYRKKVFKTMISSYFEDSYSQVVSYMAKEKKISDTDIERLKKIIREAEEKK